MAVTELPERTEMSEAEWQTRCDLAAVYRLLHHFRMTDLIYTHVSARIPGEDGTYLINNYGEMFDEITASSLIKMDYDGNVLSGDPSFNQAGFAIHSGILKVRPDVNCALHTHTLAGIAVSMTREGLLPISQDALVVMDEVGYHDYGPPGSASECEAVGQSSLNCNCMIMRNHGLLTLGVSIPAAWSKMYLLEHACAEQVAARSMGAEINEIAPEVIEEVRTRYSGMLNDPDYGQLEWRAMLRLLERNGHDYRR